jgi:lipopolysaccharide biosynthesis glycosyltransferase
MKAFANKNNVPVVYSSDDNYAKYLCVSIASLIGNASKQNNYDIIVLDGGISDLNKEYISNMSQKNVSIRFLDIKPFICDIRKKLFVSGHVSEATYYRLFICDILKDYQKIIYLDCDITFNDDVANLYNEKMKKDDLVAAVPDIGLIASREIQDIEYFYNMIGVDKIEHYFNAGVLIMNLDAMRKFDFSNKVSEFLNRVKTPRFHDQDTLNAICLNHVTFLPFKYNYWGNFKYENPGYREYFKQPWLDKFETTSKKPSLIHYKPWVMPKIEKADVFWKYARQTPFYEQILYTNIFDIDYIMKFVHRKKKIRLYKFIYKLTHSRKIKSKLDNTINELYKRV